MFYNAAMRLDRDLDVAVVRASSPGAHRSLRGWDLLAATGVRGLRLLHESDAFHEMLLTEQNAEAFAVLQRNVAPYAGEGARAIRHDATTPLEEGAFGYVDVDPFGTPVPFVPAALTAVRNEGLLAVTATDLPVLAGVSRGVCESRYRARPIRGYRAGEAAVRIVMAYLARTVGEMGRKVRPALAYVHDHYLRIYARVESSRTAESLDSVAMVPGAGWDGPSLPAGGPYGPMWMGPLFDPETVARLCVPETSDRRRELAALIARFQEEATADVPFSYEPNRLAKELGLRHPPALTRLLSMLREQGFRAARSHVRPAAFRTTAPYGVVARVAREVAPFA